ncbi:unnamed protein product [Cylindrotheca closterium]|uniref:Uncharacterized protein n=1 Tax=Cylindrotheca closterium TaxID=2856 RepID=A0AAD2G1M7_9STRA|nr:unnamed protein product [Cylindrotheca closterium]
MSLQCYFKRLASEKGAASIILISDNARSPDNSVRRSSPRPQLDEPHREGVFPSSSLAFHDETGAESNPYAKCSDSERSRFKVETAEHDVDETFTTYTGDGSIASFSDDNKGVISPMRLRISSTAMTLQASTEDVLAVILEAVPSSSKPVYSSRCDCSLTRFPVRQANSDECCLQTTRHSLPDTIKRPRRRHHSDEREKRSDPFSKRTKDESALSLSPAQTIIMHGLLHQLNLGP